MHVEAWMMMHFFLFSLEDLARARMHAVSPPALYL